MGIVLAKFRKEKTTTELLEKLEQDIKHIEEYSISTQATQKRYVGNFLVISIGFYVICFIVFYFAFFPPTWMERITYSVPLLIFPLIIFLLKRLVAWYFQRKINKNSLKFNKLTNEKKKVLEKVMEKETYKVAIQILNRFGDKSAINKTAGSVTPRVTNLPSVKIAPPTISKELAIPENSQILTNRIVATTPSPRIGDGQQQNPLSTPKSYPEHKYERNSNYLTQSLQLQRKSTPFPIINPQNRGVLEKMVDYLIGDGPQNRFAMICKQCHGHNGMALQEEYEYTSFNCIYCNTMNPSRKSRPIAPKLNSAFTNNMKIKKMHGSDSSTSTSSSDKLSDSDDEFLKVKNITNSEQINTKENVENNENKIVMDEKILESINNSSTSTTATTADNKKNE